MLRVLVLSGPPDGSKALAALVASWGHLALAAADPAQALDLAGGRRPDVALLDACTPGAYELAARLRALPGEGPVWLVALTGLGDGWCPPRAHEAGFHLFLPSPVRPEDLRHLLANLAALRDTPAAQAPGRCGLPREGVELPPLVYAGVPAALTLTWPRPGSGGPPTSADLPPGGRPGCGGQGGDISRP
jgi:CheY-like chemotaxis protein